MIRLHYAIEYNKKTGESIDSPVFFVGNIVLEVKSIA